MSEEQGGIRGRSEEALGELAQALASNPLFSQAVGTALGAGERALQVQKQTLGALDVASREDVEQLEKRIRSLSTRLEAVEDAIDELAAEVARPAPPPEPRA